MLLLLYYCVLRGCRQLVQVRERILCVSKSLLVSILLTLSTTNTSPTTDTMLKHSEKRMKRLINSSSMNTIKNPKNKLISRSLEINQASITSTLLLFAFGRLESKCLLTSLQMTTVLWDAMTQAMFGSTHQCSVAFSQCST